MKDSTKDYLKLSERDLKNARIMFDNKDYGMVCFFSQQAIEKYIKAFLIEKDIFDPKIHRIHNLRILVDECIKIDPDFKKLSFK